VGRERALVVNTGDNFSFRQEASRGLAGLYLKTFALLDAACVAVGWSELEKGPEMFAAAKNDGPPLVATNLSGGGWDEVARPFVLVERGGLKILIAAVLDPQLVAEDLNFNATLADPVAAVRALREGTAHDLLVLVAQAKRHRAEEIAAQAGGVGVLIQGAELEAPVCRSMDSGGPGGGGTIEMANRRQGTTVSFADLGRQGDGFVLLNQGVVTVAVQEPEDAQTLLLLEGYAVWSKKEKLKRPEDGYYVQVGQDFDYMDYLKQKNQGLERRE